MDIVEDMTAVQRRIAQITRETMPATESFADALRGELMAPAGSSFSAGRAEVDELARREGARFNVDPALIEAIVTNESGFDSKATSAAGAQGLMQLMPATASSLGVTDPYDPDQNVAAGTRYLRGLLDRFHRVDLAVAAYNAGPNAVKRFGGIPPFAETRAYVRAVLDEYRRRLQAGNVGLNAGSQHDGSIFP